MKKIAFSLLLVAFALLAFFVLPVHAQNAPRPYVAAGPMQGHTTDTSVAVWVLPRYAKTLKAYLLDEGGQPAGKRDYLPTSHNVGGYVPSKIRFYGLQPGKEYKMVLNLDEDVEMEYAVRTAPEDLDGVFNFDFYAGSCLDLPERGIGYLAPGITRKTLKTLAKNPADFMLWLGDNLYYTQGDRADLESMYGKNIGNRLHASLNKLLKSMPMYATWDDHDYGPNNSNGSYGGKDMALAVFKDFWANPSYGTAGAKGVFFKFSYSDADFFVLDGRYHKTDPADQNASLLGAEQFKWLEQGLKDSKATFKFVVCGVQVLSGGDDSFEGFKEFPAERERLLKTISDNNIKGVVFISGDRHFGELYQLPRSGKYDLYEVTTSPLGSTTLVIPFKIRSNDPNAVRKTRAWKPNFAHFGISGKQGSRVCLMELKNRRGKVIWSQSLRQDGQEANPE